MPPKRKAPAAKKAAPKKKPKAEQAAAALGLGLASVGAIIRARWQRTVRAQLV